MTPLGRQLNGSLGTIERYDPARRRFGVNVDNVGLQSFKPDNLGIFQ